MNTTQPQCGRTRSRIGKWLINRKLRKLQLDAAQEQQLETVFEVAHSACMDRRMHRREMHQHITEMMADDGFDRQRAIVLIRSTNERQTEHAEEVVHAFGDLYETLSPTQQEQALAIWQKRRRCFRH